MLFLSSHTILWPTHFIKALKNSRMILWRKEVNLFNKRKENLLTNWLRLCAVKRARRHACEGRHLKRVSRYVTINYW
jgi:hypothetical protein